MSKKVSFVCNKESVDLFVKLLNKLQKPRGDRKIRIGGSEYSFYKDLDDGITDLAIDNRYYRDMTPSEQRDLEIIRINSIMTTQSLPSVPVDTKTNDNDNDNDNDNVDDAQVSCDDCGRYVSQSDLDAQGLCDLCSATSNLPDADKNIIMMQLTELISKEKLFTAFDITKRARKLGVRCKHSDVKDIVHDMYLSTGIIGYNRVLIDVGEPIQPWLYYPTSRDSSEYNHGDN